MPTSLSRTPSASTTPARQRRRPAGRACDRCRRRKARCDFEGSGGIGTCSLCRDAEERCTFDLPQARRGPKAKRKSAGPNVGGEIIFDGSDLSPGAVPAPPSLARRPSRAGLIIGSATTSPVAAWETPSILEVADAASPQVSHGSIADLPASTSLSSLERWQRLSRALALRNAPIHRTIPRCLDLFFEYLYPLTPLVHEPSLRDALSYFLRRGSSVFTSPTSPLGTGLVSTLDVSTDFWPEPALTLITAVCAEAAFLLPKVLFPEGETVADLLLHASRDCLNSYLEADLENPNANSVAIRYFHSNCLHAAGKPKYSWHIFGEATRLAQVMQLHEETSLEGLYPIEAEMRRRVFWIVYMGDKSAAILNNRPITIHKFSFESGISTSYPTGIEEEIAPGPSPGNAEMAEIPPKSFIEGFNANLRLWQAASDLLLEVRLLAHEAGRESTAPSTERVLLTPAERRRLEFLYIRFTTCLDSLPPYLQSYTFAAIANGARTTQSNQFIIQCANLQVSLHCLRMVIAQKLEDVGYLDVGVEEADLRKTEIARDMLRVMHEAPFWSLQVNGEPYVEKIRLIGATLLAIIHRNQASPLAARARADFMVLLDILTRLDSKASDALKINSASVL